MDGQENLQEHLPAAIQGKHYIWDHLCQSDNDETLKFHRYHMQWQLGTPNSKLHAVCRCATDMMVSAYLVDTTTIICHCSLRFINIAAHMVSATRYIRLVGAGLKVYTYVSAFHKLQICDAPQGHPSMCRPNTT